MQRSLPLQHSSRVGNFSLNLKLKEEGIFKCSITFSYNGEIAWLVLEWDQSRAAAWSEGMGKHWKERTKAASQDNAAELQKNL